MRNSNSNSFCSELCLLYLKKVKRMYVSEVDLLYKEWDVVKNSALGLDPTKIVVGSNKYAFWKCDTCGYEWKAQITKRGVRGQGCPICGKEKQRRTQLENQLRKQGSLLDRFPSVAEEWDYEKNQGRPEEYLSGSNKKAFWICEKCGYKWEAVISKRTLRGQGCPECGKIRVKRKIHERIKNRIEIEGSLGTLYPKLEKEWDYDKNSLTPFDYLPNSTTHVYWICSQCGHSWNAIIYSRTQGAGCPVCGQKKGTESLLKGLIEKQGSLADNLPEIAKEWDFVKNGQLTPDQVMVNTNKSVWWLCSECGYSWRTQVYNRSLGKGCPKCALIKQGIASSKPIEGINDLLSQAPELAKEWHPDKNGDLKPSDVTKWSNKKVWWLGKCGHEWQAAVGNRFLGRGCPICLKEFKISYPEKVIFFYLNKYLGCVVEENYKTQWLKGKELDIFIPSLNLGIEYDGKNWHKNEKNDLEKNRLCLDNGVELLRIREAGLPNLSVNNVFEINTRTDMDDELRKVIDYVFEFISSTYGLRVKYEIDLSNDRANVYELMETNRKDNSLARLYPEIAREWNTNKNGRLSPEYVNAHSHRKHWWVCHLGHEYEMSVKDRVEKVISCPICSNHRVLSGFNDLEHKRPDLMGMWDYDHNIGILPSQVMEYSNIKVWWKCEKGHSYERMISHQSSRDSGCPICKMQVLQEGVNDLQTLFPDIASEWDYKSNHNEKPSMYTPISHKRFNWKCNQCGCEWNISINSRCILGHGCPKCAGKKRLESRKRKKE